jgi:hypothetical protein
MATARRAFLACGIVSSLLYGAMIWAIRYEGYSLVSQVPSERINISVFLLWVVVLATVLLRAPKGPARADHRAIEQAA